MSELARIAIGHLPAFASMWSDDVKIAWFAAYAKLCEACRATGETPPAHPEVSEQSSRDAKKRALQILAQYPDVARMLGEPVMDVLADGMAAGISKDQIIANLTEQRRLSEDALQRSLAREAELMQLQPIRCRSLLKKALLALQMAHAALASKGYADYASLEPQIALAISKADQFLADPQQVERDAAKCLVGGCLQAPVSGNRICPEHQDVLGITEDSNA